MSKEPTSFRLSTDGRRLLDQLASRLGVSRTAILELLIREKAKQEGVTVTMSKTRISRQKGEDHA
jgi:hypothetical protein